MDGDELLTCPPIPEFWLVKYRFSSSYSDLRTIQQSFFDLGFGVLAYTDEIGYIKVYHYKPKYMSVWLLQNDSLIKKHRLTVERYLHNTKSKRKKTWDLILSKSLLTQTDYNV